MNDMQKKDNSGLILAVALIAVGVVWLVRQSGIIPYAHELHVNYFLFPFRHTAISLGQIPFSWQMVLIVTGVILVAGKRTSGLVLIVLGGVLLLPDILHITFLSLSVHIPALLVVTGIVLILKASLN